MNSTCSSIARGCRARVQTVAVDEEQAELARAAWRRYGKGRHAAGLNYGDLFAYALARATGDPLLFTGDDVARTDIAAVSVPLAVEATRPLMLIRLPAAR